MTIFSFEHELWAQDDEQVDEMLVWAREQDEWDLNELWLAVFISTPGNGIDNVALDSNNAPLNYRSN